MWWVVMGVVLLGMYFLNLTIYDGETESGCKREAY